MAAWPQPGVTSPIVGPRTFEQLEDLLGASDVSLSARGTTDSPRTPELPASYQDRMLREQSGIDVVVPLRR